MKKRTVIMLILSLVLGLVGVSPASEAAGKVKLNKTSVTLKEGKSVKLALKNVKEKDVKWKSSKPAVATVNKSGLVKAKKKGTAKITAEFESKKYTCKVTVLKKINDVQETDEPIETEEPVETEEPTPEPIATATVAPTVAPTLTPIPTVAPTPTAAVSSVTQNRLDLIAFVQRNGTTSSSGKKQLEYQYKNSSNNSLTLATLSTDGEDLTMGCGFGMPNGSNIWTATVAITFSPTISLAPVAFIMTIKSPSGTSVYEGRMSSLMSLDEIISTEKTYTWGSLTSTSSYMKEEDVRQTADMLMHLLYSSQNVLLTTKGAGMKMVDLGFGS